jgi:hypothetical protein
MNEEVINWKQMVNIKLPGKNAKLYNVNYTKKDH